jgi:hypothetical protein
MEQRQQVARQAQGSPISPMLTVTQARFTSSIAMRYEGPLRTVDVTSDLGHFLINTKELDERH